ncbi:MAG: hypothetical protein LUD46_22510 [Parabacteroides sp.]|nr:hypothetical protein [Parabacteroides sp.]
MAEAINYKLYDRRISRKLSAINVQLYLMGKTDGKKPILIFDEAENLTLNTFQMLKAMYDTLKWTCATVLIGTDQLITTMDRLKSKNKPGMPQFYRRFKAGIRHIEPMDKNFDAFLADMPFPSSFKKTIRCICENYGELHDFLVPAMREADEMNVPLTEKFFRMKYQLPIND